MDKISLPQSVAAYAPAHVVRRVLEGSPPRPGEAELIEAAVLFADIAGFTTMSEQMVHAHSHLAPHEGHRGSEELNRLLNETFTALMQPILKHGGIVTRFSGDALTAYFERSPILEADAVIACALSCAHAMQRAIEPFRHTEVAGHDFPINVKIGLGYGQALRLTVGDAQLGLESVLAGQAVDEATLAEKHARQGEVVIAQSSLALLGAQPTTGEARDAFVVVTHAQDTCAPNAAPLNLDHLDEAASHRLLEALALYLPREIYTSLSLTGGDLPGDFRRVTSIFVGFEGIQYDSPSVGYTLQDYFVWAQNVVARFEGRLNRVITGDKGSVLHILFGAPGKHDDDLERALRCALAIKNDSSRPASIVSQRIGMASGIVLARPIGSMVRREYTVIGDEINLSSRLMTAGKPGDILVDSYTRDRTAQRFVFETLPPMQLKGKTLPVKAYRLLSERETITGLTVRYLSSRWRLVGRDTERATLIAAADRALSGRGNVIAIGGRAGVGKTRLIEEVVRHWVNWGGDGYIGQCLSHGLNSPYLPWIDLWHVFFKFLESDDAAARWHKIEAGLAAEVGAMSQWGGILGAVLGLPVPESQFIAALDAADRRRKLFELSLELLRARATRQPLLLLFEDLQWADRPSLDLIDHIAAHTSDVPLLVCLCSRPRDDLNLQAMASPDCTFITLEELPPEHSAQMIRTVLNQTGLPLPFEREIYEKTQGNPLFVEELLNSLIQSGVLERANGGYKVVGDLSQAQVPDTLQDLLMARIDRLEPPSRDLLQVASVIDRRFAYDILRSIYPFRMEDIEMRDRLDATILVDLTRLAHPEPELAYLFKHAMTYEVAYSSLPFARRRQLHERVGCLFEQTYSDHLEQYYPMLARHFGQGERWDKTLTYALCAGRQAQKVYANDEALAYYEQAERCLKKLPLEDHWSSALQLYLSRATIYRLKGQYDLAEADVNRALELAQAHNDLQAQAEAYNVLAEARWWQERNEEARQAAQLAYGLALQCQGDTQVLTALRVLGTAYHALGQYDQAMDCLIQARDLAQQRNDQITLGAILNAIGGMHLYLGHFDQALQSLQQALGLLETVDLKYRMAGCLTNIGIAQFHCGQPHAALDAYRRAVEVGLAGGYRAGVAYTYLSQAEAFEWLGEYAQALTMCQKASTVFGEIGDAVGEAYQQVQAGEAYLALESYSQARAAFEPGLKVMRETGNAEESMRALLGLAECELHSRNLHAAEDYLRQINDLNQAMLPVWRAATRAWLTACLALARGDLERADELALEIERLIHAGSDPGVSGPMWALRAQIALARHNHREARAHFENAIAAVQERSSFASKLFVLNQAGAYLASGPESEAIALGQQCREEAAAMLHHLESERGRCLNLAESQNGEETRTA